MIFFFISSLEQLSFSGVLFSFLELFTFCIFNYCLCSALYHGGHI